MKNNNFVNSGSHGISQEPKLREKGEGGGGEGDRLSITYNWVRKSSDHGFFFAFKYIWSYSEKNRSKSSLIANLFKVLITFSHRFFGALSSPMSLVSFDV